jgi:hypothetical protein
MTTTRTTPSFTRRVLAASAVGVLSLGAVACESYDDGDVDIDNPADDIENEVEDMENEVDEEVDTEDDTDTETDTDTDTETDDG